MPSKSSPPLICVPLISTADAQFFHLIEAAPDDNKFVGCAICGNAELIVTNDALNSAINGKKAVILKNYASSHSKATKDYRVEPFKLNANYIDIWAYDLADGINKRFKTDRIGEVEILRDDWEHEDSHEAEALDAFRIHGNDPVHVAIRMDMVARNLLLEEYQLRFYKQIARFSQRKMLNL